MIFRCSYSDHDTVVCLWHKQSADHLVHSLSTDRDDSSMVAEIDAKARRDDCAFPCQPIDLDVCRCLQISKYSASGPGERDKANKRTVLR